MNGVLNVARLQMNKRDVTFGTPAGIVGVVLILSALIAIALQRAGIDPAAPDYVAGARNNLGIVWSLPGFLIYYGVQAVATTFPFAMALGSTRRAYVLGTALANVVTALYISLILTALLLLELATGHWWFDIYVLDNYALGSGNVWVLIPTVFIGVLFCTSIGGMFAGVWVRYGNRGPTILGLLIGLVLATLILVFVPYAGEIFATITAAKLAGVALGLSALALFGTWLAMRRTAVR